MVRTRPIEPPAVPLTDGTVALRPRRESDLDAMAEASRDPEVRRWLDDEPMDEQARRTGVARAEQAWRMGTAAPLTIADGVTDEPVGSINLQFRSDTEATVAYGVFPQCRGRGIAPRAVRLLARWALSDLKLDRVILEADERNTASIRVAEKCGFHRIDTRTEPAGDGGQRSIAVFAQRRHNNEPTRHGLETLSGAYELDDVNESRRPRPGRGDGGESFTSSSS